MEILTGVERRRRWSSEEKIQLLREAATPGASVAVVARRHDISRSQIYQWRRAFRSGRLRSEALAVVDFLPVEVCDEENDEETAAEAPTCSDVPISIDLHHGRTLRFSSGLSSGEIKRLIAAVEAA